MRSLRLNTLKYRLYLGREEEPAESSWYEAYSYTPPSPECSETDLSRKRRDIDFAHVIHTGLQPKHPKRWWWLGRGEIVRRKHPSMHYPNLSR